MIDPLFQEVVSAAFHVEFKASQVRDAHDPATRDDARHEADKALEAFQEALQRLRDKGFPTDLTDERKEDWKRDFPRSLDKLEGRARDMFKAATEGLPAPATREAGQPLPEAYLQALQDHFRAYHRASIDFKKALEKAQDLARWIDRRAPSAAMMPSPETSPSSLDYVTLDQAAAHVSRSKRTLEKAIDRPKNPIPHPEIQGGGGKASALSH